MTKTMTNLQIINTLNASVDEAGKSLRAKRLPVKLLYALQRNLRELESAYTTYNDTRKELCQRYQVQDTAMEKGGEEFQQELITLLNLPVEVDIHTVSIAVLDECGQGNFDSLSMNDLDRLDWLIEKK